MFNDARIKLTSWYLLILMSISIIFSFFIYRGIITEVERSIRIQEFRLYRATHPFDFSPPSLEHVVLDPQLLSDVEERIILTLVFINLGICVISAAAGYFLAGRTLSPIQKMVEDQNRFIADASHELRTPLTSLKSEIEVYLRGKNNTKEEANILIKSNLEEVNALQILSENLLQLAQYDRPVKESVKFETIQLSECISLAIAKVKSIAKKKNINIENNVDSFLLPADQESIVQLFIIFLDNAIKYSPENEKITISAKPADRFVLVSIKDNGIGISKEDLPHIFERFYRADISRTKQKKDGYGLGLSIAQKIVKPHNGNISVKSSLDKGTTFIVQLPVLPLKQI